MRQNELNWILPSGNGCEWRRGLLTSMTQGHERTHSEHQTHLLACGGGGTAHSASLGNSHQSRILKPVTHSILQVVRRDENTSERLSEIPRGFHHSPHLEPTDQGPVCPVMTWPSNKKQPAMTCKLLTSLRLSCTKPLQSQIRVPLRECRGKWMQSPVQSR